MKLTNKQKKTTTKTTKKYQLLVKHTMPHSVSLNFNKFRIQDHEKNINGQFIKNLVKGHHSFVY